MHSLSIEFSSQINDYLLKVNKAIEKVKAESYAKLKRRALFNSGIDFHSRQDVDESKKVGVE